MSAPLEPGIEDAILLAVTAHRGQRDRAGQPYVLHPLRVMMRLDGLHERMAAVLHDVVEDTEHSLESLRALGYPEPVLAALDCLTRRGGESYEEFVERILDDPLARRVKLADLEDNMDVRRLPTFGDRDTERVARYLAAWHRIRAREAQG